MAFLQLKCALLVPATSYWAKRYFWKRGAIEENNLGSFKIERIDFLTCYVPGHNNAEHF